MRRERIFHVDLEIAVQDAAGAAVAIAAGADRVELCLGRVDALGRDHPRCPLAI